MQFSSSLYLFLGLPAAMAAAVPTVQPREESGIEGYRTEPILWEVPVFPGGENATIAGTVEEVHAELLRRNPQWDTDFPLEVAARSLGSFGGFDETHTVCGPGSFGWQFALTSVINDGIKYLRRVGGHPRHGPGPGSCGRVSCSFGGGIWWCNDRRETVTLRSYGEIADGAEQIVGKCRSKRSKADRLPPPSLVLGQAFHSDGMWNVIARGDKC